MRNLLRVVWAFVVRDFAIEFSYRLAFILQVFGLFISTTLWFFMARFIHGVSDAAALRQNLNGLDYFAYSLSGLMVTRFLDVAQYSFSSVIRSEQTTGTLEVMLVTRTRLAHIMVSASAFSYIFAGLQSGLYLLFGVTIFGIRLQLGNILAAGAAILLTALALSGIGILSAAFVLYFKRGNPIDFLISTASLLFGNVLIPTKALPVQIAWISKLIPVTYATDAVRGALLQGKAFSEMLPNLLALGIFAAVLLPIGLVGARIAVRKAKQEGSLVQY